MRFVPPCQPRLRSYPPHGPQWLHEVKFDGYRVQLHKPVTIYSKKGVDFTRRFLGVAMAIDQLRCSSCIIDGELVAPDKQGRPDFAALHQRRSNEFIVWCFDLIELNGEDLRAMQLVDRKAKLQQLIKGSELLRYSDVFDNPDLLLDVVAEHGLEGIVSKRVNFPYRPGKCD